MFRAVKYSVAAFLAVLIGGVLLLGPGFFSYVRTSARSVQDSVQETVPIEFELRRARDLIEAILPELQAQVRMIAQEEVEIAALRRDVSQTEHRLEDEFASLSKLRDQMRTQTVSFKADGRNLNRTQMTEQLARRLDRYKTSRLALAAKERLLEKRNESLAAALASLDSMRHRKAELEQKVEALAAQARLVQASKIDAGIQLNGSDLSDADQLLQQIETRLAVAQRVLEHEQDVFAIELEGENQSEDQVLADYDEYFGNENAPPPLVSSL
ncbi:signal peptide-containing protein [Stieleria mannarensis]|uniref:signal peptide-containing protein n=1 Tax=Stieleria mannarensis TaxID=2755585 RepID=UPI00160113C0|nr:signal peptide-containing protein [Rhodopirellula sp. JC639]